MLQKTSSVKRKECDGVIERENNIKKK